MNLDEEIILLQEKRDSLEKRMESMLSAMLLVSIILLLTIVATLI